MGTRSDAASQRSKLVGAIARSLLYTIKDPLGRWAAGRAAGIDFGWHQRYDVDEPPRAATVFDSSVVPPIGIDKYLLRLAATFRCSDASFVAALVLVYRLLGRDSGRISLTMKNVHRLFLGSLVVTVKYNEDFVYANSHYAKAGGVHLRDVNRLERSFLATLDFDLRVNPHEYRLYENMLWNGNAYPQNSRGGANDAAALPKVTPPARPGIDDAALPALSMVSLNAPAVTATSLAVLKEVAQKGIEDEEVSTDDSVSDFNYNNVNGTMSCGSSKTAASAADIEDVEENEVSCRASAAE